MTVLGELKYVLRLEVSWNASFITICQKKYTNDLPAQVGILNCNPCLTPCATMETTTSSKVPLNDIHMYRSLVGVLQSLVGVLQYLTFTRPDISFAVKKECKKMHSPTEGDFTVVKRIPQYLRGSVHIGLTYKAGSLDLKAFCDTDWTGDPTNRWFTTGYIVF